MNIFELCFDGVEGYVELSLGGVLDQHRKWITVEKALSLGGVPDNTPSAYFGPALRRSEGAMGKANVKCSQVCWVDIDRGIKQIPSILPPTAVVWSGHGLHGYWRIDRPISDLTELERLNKLLAVHTDADSCHNADRVMRVPGSLNVKEDTAPVQCRLVDIWPGRIYSAKDIDVLSQLGQKCIHKILTGDKRGFRTRSERDWSIVSSLLLAGCSEDTIKLIFSVHQCGDKYRDPSTDGERYLQHTIKRAGLKAQEKLHIVRAADDGYFVGTRRVSTFVMKPKLLLEGDIDSFLCDIHASGTDHVWKDIVVPVTAFASSRAFCKSLTRAAWVWLGRDNDIKALQMSLIRELQNNGVPRAVATSVRGRHVLENDERSFFVADDCTLASDGSVWDMHNAPIIYVDPHRETPRIALRNTQVDRALLSEIAVTLPQINRPGTIWPMLGWFMATPMKPEFKRLGYRFPILNVFGTRGSGKTTTIMQVFQPMLGFVEERSYDANTTRFVCLSLLGSTNAVPIAFSEFRVAQVTDFTRYVLLAYDTGRDPRGRADQTTVDYPLVAPFSIDGEDMVEDPASIERVVAVRMVPADIAENTAAWKAFSKLQTLELAAFAGPYVMYTLRSDVGSLIDTAEQDIWEAFPETLPTRIRRNLTIAWAGVLSVAAFMRTCNIYCYPEEGARVMAEALDNVFSVSLGRAPTEADAFIEIIVNTAARGTRLFPWVLDNGILWFQLMPAFEFYAGQRAHQRRSTLSRKTIRTQLLELVGEFVVAPEVRVIGGRRVQTYGIDLSSAHKAGLDVPSRIRVREVVIDLGGGV